MLTALKEITEQEPVQVSDTEQLGTARGADHGGEQGGVPALFRQLGACRTAGDYRERESQIVGVFR